MVSKTLGITAKQSADRIFFDRLLLMGGMPPELPKVGTCSCRELEGLPDDHVWASPDAEACAHEKQLGCPLALCID